MLVLYLVHFAIYHNFDLHSVPKQPDITVTCPGTPAQPTGEQCWYYDSHGAIHYVPANQTHP